MVELLTTQLSATPIASHDKPVGGNACIKFRPDILYDCGGWAVIVEVDENAHRDYDRVCERNRMRAIMETLSMRTVFLRYNPDAFQHDGKTVWTSKEERHKHLISRLQHHLKTEPSELLVVEYLFYDTSSTVPAEDPSLPCQDATAS